MVSNRPLSKRREICRINKMASRGGFLISDGALRRKNTTKQQHNSGFKPHKVLTRKKKKPEWDSSVNDLNVHKPTEDELRKRHEAHKSKNLGLPHRKKSGKENESLLLNTPETVMLRKQAILQEILHGEDKFQDVLAETDRTMSAVKDLFGDDPKKILGFPNVTVAPNRTDVTSESSRPVTAGLFADVPETPTHLSILSDSIMRTPALNEVSDDNEMSDSSPETTETTKFEPKLDLQRYRQFISHEAANEKQLDVIPERLQTNVDKKSSAMVHERSVIEGVDVPGQVLQPNDKIPDQTPAVSTSANQIPTNYRQIERPPDYEHTDIPKKSKDKSKPKSLNNTGTSSSNNGLKSLEDLKKMVESLEDEIAEYELETGRQPTATTLQTSSFSGYTSSLITAVTKLMKYLKETETQRKAEAVLREQILQGFAEQRTLVDALTNDILLTQEMNATLQRDFHAYRHHTDSQLGLLQRELQSVLKSFEYHTVQTTINTLHSTKPVPLPQIHSNSQLLNQNKAMYIPVTTAVHDESYRGDSSDPPASTHAVSDQQDAGLRWNDQGVTCSNSAQTECVNPVISNGNVSSNTHIHINQPYLHHEADNFTIQQPVQKHLTIPGHSELRTQQTNASTSAVVTSSSANTGLNPHANNWQENQMIRNGPSNQGNWSYCDARFGLNSQNDFISNGQNDQGILNNINTRQDQRYQKDFNDNDLTSDQRFVRSSDNRQNYLNGHTDNILHDARNEYFREGQFGQPLHFARKELFSKGQNGQPLHNTRQENINGPSLDNPITSLMPGHNTEHVMHNRSTQKSHFSGGQRECDVMYPNLSSLAPTHIPTQNTQLQQPYSKANSNDLFPKTSSSFSSMPNENIANTQGNSLSCFDTHAEYVPISSQRSMTANSAHKQSHEPLHDRSDWRLAHVGNGSTEGQFNDGLQYMNDAGKDDSLLMKSLIKDPLAAMRLRNRLEGIATKQKNTAALNTTTQPRTVKHSKGIPSPHVHFKSPLEEPKTKGLRHGIVPGLPEKSPSVSPIPDDVPSVEMVVPKNGCQVVVNLPSIWSDVSSTVSI